MSNRRRNEPGKDKDRAAKNPRPRGTPRRAREAMPASTPQKKPAPATAPATANATQMPRPLFSAPISVRWRDLDAFNHVNNSNFLTYLEEARLQWLKTVPGPWFDTHSMPVMAAAEVNYRAPIAWPAEIVVELSCERLGNSSLAIGHRIVDASDPRRLYCDGRVVMVWMDPIDGRSVALPPAIREACAPETPPVAGSETHGDS